MAQRQVSQRHQCQQSVQWSNLYRQNTLENLSIFSSIAHSESFNRNAEASASLFINMSIGKVSRRVSTVEVAEEYRIATAMHRLVSHWIRQTENPYSSRFTMKMYYVQKYFERCLKRVLFKRIFIVAFHVNVQTIFNIKQLVYRMFGWSNSQLISWPHGQLCASTALLSREYAIIV